jgi:hypothetical protein
MAKQNINIKDVVKVVKAQDVSTTKPIKVQPPTDITNVRGDTFIPDIKL